MVTAVLDVLGRAGTGCNDAGRRRVLSRHAAEVRKAFEARGKGSARDLDMIDTAFRCAVERLASG